MPVSKLLNMTFLSFSQCYESFPCCLYLWAIVGKVCLSVCLKVQSILVTHARRCFVLFLTFVCLSVHQFSIKFDARGNEWPNIFDILRHGKKSVTMNEDNSDEIKLMKVFISSFSHFHAQLKQKRCDLCCIKMP